MDNTNSSDSELLLLELGISADKSEFDKAKLLLEDLREDMQDMDVSFSLDNLNAGLRTAGTILKGLVDSWNSLKDKTITVAYATNNYLPYNLDPGTRQNIENRLNESTVAQKFGVTPETVLSDLSGIIAKQGQTKMLGHFVSDEDANALYQLGSKLNDPRFQGENLSRIFTDASSVDIYKSITDMLANAYREAYKLPDKSEERQEWLKLISNVLATPYVNKSVGELIAFYTEPDNPTYSKSGDPMSRYFSASVEDDGKYMQRLKKWQQNAIDLATDIDLLVSEAKESVSTARTGFFNAVGENVVLPLLKNVVTLTDVLSGKRMSTRHEMELFPNIGSQDTHHSLGDLTLGYVDRETEARLASRFGLSANWVEGAKDPTVKQEKLLSIDTGDALANELRMYELMRMSQSTYEIDAKGMLDYAVARVGAKSEFDVGRKKKYKTPYEAYTAVGQELLDPNSKYYIGEEGNFFDVYTMLYKTGSLSDRDTANTKLYLQAIARMFENTKRKELSSFYGENFSSPTDITKAEVKNVGSITKPDYRLVITIKEDGKTDREYPLTAEQLASGVLNVEHTLEKSKAGY